MSQQIPPEFVSSGNELVVVFRTDDTISKKGFSAAFVLASPDSLPVTFTPKSTGNSSNPEFKNKQKSNKKLANHQLSKSPSN